MPRHPGLFLSPLDGFGSAVLSFRLHPVFGAVSNRVPPGDTLSRFVGFGDKSRDNSKNYFRTQGFEFLFLSPMGAAGCLWRLDSAENARFET